MPHLVLITINGEDKAYHHDLLWHLGRKEDTKKFWKGKKEKLKQVTYSLWGNFWLKSRSFLFAKNQINKILFIRQWLKCSNQKRHTSVKRVFIFQQNPAIFLLKIMLNYNQKMLKRVSQLFSLMRLLPEQCQKSEHRFETYVHSSWEGWMEEDKDKAILT